MLLRIALVVGACLAIVFGASRLRDEHRCTTARQAIVTALFNHRTPDGGLAHQQKRLLDGCRDGSVLALVSTVETTAGFHGPATALARKVTRDEPRNRVGWIALAQALERSDPRGAAAARTRAQALDPRGRIPRAAGAGAGLPPA
jgi:Flp pilus assembly protein TadD